MYKLVTLKIFFPRSDLQNCPPRSSPSCWHGVQLYFIAFLSSDIFIETLWLSGEEEFHSQRATVALSALEANNVIVSAHTRNNRSIDFNSPAGTWKLCLIENEKFIPAEDL